jgi:hypothetical protein
MAELVEVLAEGHGDIFGVIAVHGARWVRADDLCMGVGSG